MCTSYLHNLSYRRTSWKNPEPPDDLSEPRPTDCSDRNSTQQASADGGRDRTIAFFLESSRRFWVSITWVEESWRKRWTSVFLNLKTSSERGTLNKHLDCRRKFWMHQWTADTIQQEDAFLYLNVQESRTVLRLFTPLPLQLTKHKIFLYSTKLPFETTRWNDKEKNTKILFNSVQSFQIWEQTSLYCHDIRGGECQVNMQGSILFIPSYTEAWTHTSLKGRKKPAIAKKHWQAPLLAKILKGHG